MKLKSLLLVTIFALTPVIWAQNASMQSPASGHGHDQAHADHQEMMAMHKQEIEAMKADVETMKASLAQMKANLLTIPKRNEMSRWRNNAEK